MSPPPQSSLQSSLPCIIIVVAVILRGLQQVVTCEVTGDWRGSGRLRVMSYHSCQVRGEMEKKGSYTDSCELMDL